MNEPFLKALKVYKDNEEHFDGVIDHAIQYGQFESNNKYIACYYIIKTNRVKKLQKCLDNSYSIYVSLFAGDMKSFFKNTFNKEIKYCLFRRNFGKLKVYNYERMLKLIGVKYE